jgi:NAD+ diphosphatase
MLTTFAGAGIDRAGERRRDPAWVAERLADPRTRAVGVTRRGVVVVGGADVVSREETWDPPERESAEPVRLARLPVAGEDPILLGVEPDGTALFAIAVDAPPEGTREIGLRDAAVLLDQSEGGLAAYATAMLGWHRAHGFCAHCGHATEMIEAGHVRSCPECGRQHHPRTDAVVIMLVLRGDDVLLGRQASWPPGRYSALAGFVEPGEALEEAVAREVQEEAGVQIADIRYVASQPWPFPASLMLGFFADYAGGEPAIGDQELEDVRWFTRDEVRAAADGDESTLKLPPRLAIARTLIDGWLAGRSAPS